VKGESTLFPNLLIELELYAIVIGLCIGLFVFLARERLRRLEQNRNGVGEPLVEDTHATPNPFMRAGSTF
jgi:hypothetical protein